MTQRKPEPLDVGREQEWNRDPQQSARPCGCDPGENHLCEQHQTDTPLSFDSPDSKLIVRANYDPSTRVMEITFNRPSSSTDFTNPTYIYGGITSELWEDFEQAESKGGFFSKHIRTMFSGKPKGTK